MRTPLGFFAWLLCFASCVWAEDPIELRDMTETTGIQFKHTDGGTGKRYVVEPVCSGVATFDYDNDGLIDIYFLTGGPLGGKTVANPPTNALYRNLGNFRFADVTQKAGVGKPGYAMAVAVGDYDNDGHQDIFLSNYGPNVLYHNEGNGTFVDATETAGVGPQDKTAVGAGSAFLDADADGDLDLFVGNYLTFSYHNHPRRTFMGVHVYPGPLEFPPVPDNLYRNNGDRTFTDVSQESGIGTMAATTMGMVCGDYNNDGFTDIFVGNDVMPNFLWQNDGKGKFEEVALLSGVAYDTSGAAHSNMGVECGDYDNDEQLDFLLTAFHRELVALFRNLGGGEFEDVARSSGAGEGTFNQVKWGVGFVDFDNDGYRDIFIACGNLYDNVEEFDRTTSYRSRNAVLRNLGNGRFLNITDECGEGLQRKNVGRGAAFDDLDNDGRVDVVVNNSRTAPTILRNESVTSNHWLQLQLQGVKTNHDGVGARVRVTAGDLIQIDEVHAGRGYQSHYGTRLHFGLGKHDRVDRIEVRWVGGSMDVLENIPVDQRLTIVEGGQPTANR